MYMEQTTIDVWRTPEMRENPQYGRTKVMWPNAWKQTHQPGSGTCWGGRIAHGITVTNSSGDSG